tara:strand:- start:10175 stop:12010 length:1836 start_codon:yes stop_codon:yes gene_type:complete
MKIIRNFTINLEDMSAAAQTREFYIEGDENAIISLEVKNEDNYYYNFATKAFAAAKYTLKRKRLKSGIYRNSISFPKITDNDQYDIYLFAENGYDTHHAPYNEVRFDDGSLDINSSTGSNSSLMKKVIYQYTDTTVTLSAVSPNALSGFTSMSVTDDTVVVPRNTRLNSKSFSVVVTAAATKAFYINTQPTENDITASVSRVFGADPVDIKGENIYPEERAAFTGDDVNGAITSGSVVRMDNTDLSAAIEVGDKITSPVTTDTVNGDFSGGATAITMDTAVATKMAVGDRVTGTTALDAGEFLVDSIDSTNVFSLSASAAIDDGTTLTFSSKVNRSLTTVTVVETSGTDTDFTMSQAIQFRDNQPLVFSPRKNYRWSLTGAGILGLTAGVKPIGTNITTDSFISVHEDLSTYTTVVEDEFGGLEDVTKIITNAFSPATDTVSKKPTITNGVVSAQLGDITFNNQQALVLGGDTVTFYAYGPDAIESMVGPKIELSNLKIELTKPTTTTTGAISNSTTISVADREGVINNISKISGIGIDPTVVDPFITAGGGTDGSGNWTASAAQTLESGITLTVENTSRVATITGDIAITNMNAANFTLKFDLEKLLTAS